MLVPNMPLSTGRLHGLSMWTMGYYACGQVCVCVCVCVPVMSGESSTDCCEVSLGIKTNMVLES